jgi:hypothetical protein
MEFILKTSILAKIFLKKELFTGDEKLFFREMLHFRNDLLHR